MADDVIRLPWRCMALPLKSRGILYESRGVLLIADDVIRLSKLCMAPLRSWSDVPASACGPSTPRSSTVDVPIHQLRFMVTSRFTESLRSPLEPRWLTMTPFVQSCCNGTAPLFRGSSQENRPRPATDELERPTRDKATVPGTATFDAGLPPQHPHLATRNHAARHECSDW